MDVGAPPLMSERDREVLRSFARRIEDWGTVQAVERLNLDGLLALWHPLAAN